VRRVPGAAGQSSAEIRGAWEGRGRAPAGGAAGSADGPRAWAAGAGAMDRGGSRKRAFRRKDLMSMRSFYLAALLAKY
jgi:hypothetical protein